MVIYLYYSNQIKSHLLLMICMNIQTTSSGIEKDIIIDGDIMEENLTSAGLDIKWLTSNLVNKKSKIVQKFFMLE
ncbi:YetF domain-containing protein [Peribacillus kribbensis]|uniref:YetF domain-containing protein n=1 Tax=Peribacillus kribbensis TaxID=356658 RepID=UPI003CCBC2D3